MSFVRLALLGLLVLAAQGAAAAVLQLGPADGSRQALGIPGSVQQLAGPGDSDAAELLSGARDADFAPYAGQPLRCDSGHGCWLRFTLARDADAPPDWWLRLRTVRTGTLTLYQVPQGTRATGLAHTPRQFPLNWRYVDTEQFFELTLGTAPSTYYLHIRDVVSADGVSLLQERAFDRQQRRLATLLSVSLGVTLALMVLNLVFWRWLRDTLFLHFGAFLAVAVLLHLWQIVPAMATPERMGDMSLRGGLQALMQTATVLFIARLFDFRHQLRGGERAVQACVLANLLLGLGSLLGHQAALETWVAVADLAGMAGALAAVAWLLFVRQQWHLAWPAVLVTVIALTSGLGRLRWLGLVEAGPDEGLGLTWAAVRLVYMLLLAITVADRTRRAELQLRQSRRRALDEAQRAERLLEDKVRQRTEELHGSNARLASEIERRREAEAGLVSALATERRILQQQREFVSLVSHEFRTPLAVIDAAAQSMGLPGVEAQPRLAKIRRAVHRLRTLVVNCLAEDRLRSAATTLRREPLDLRAVIGGAVAQFGAQERERIRWQLPAAAASVHGDAALLDVAVHNLLQNALKYSPAQGEVHVRLAQEAGHAVVDVEDQGGGIAPGQHERIFERYFRGDSAGSTGGTGLGLFLGSQIARAHDGSLALLRSGAKGSVFRLRLPLLPAHEIQEIRT